MEALFLECGGGVEGAHMLPSLPGGLGPLHHS